jgi:phenylpropionate dioxygenase-like ring-hydroxylating dioxygenase large terminal subunit
MADEDGAALAGQLMGALGAGATDLADLATRLNDGGATPSSGERWSPQVLAAELARLAIVPAKATIDRTVSPVYDAARANWPPAPSARNATAMDVDARAEFLQTFGLRNQWYIIASSAEIGATPVGMKRLGESLVLWRDGDGAVHAVEDRCPHRGVALSIGEVHEGAITCAYHGVRVDAYGKVVLVPGLPGCPLEGKTLVRHYPVIEHYQAIWAYFGDDRHEAPPPLVLPDELVSPEWTGVLHYDTWRGDYRYVIDNLCDPMHGPFLHGKTYTQSRGPRTDAVNVVENDGGFEVFRAGQRGVNLDWMEFCLAGSSTYARVEIPMPPNAGPGGPMGIIFYPTPVDEDHTRINVWRLRHVSGWQRDLWHFLFHAKIRGFVDAVLAQDIVALATMPRWPSPEHLYGHDAGITRARKHFREAAKAQARDWDRAHSGAAAQ